jgi:hypothetical protein
MGKEEDTDLRYSPDVAEILDRKPFWLVRRGTLIAAVIFAACLAASYFVPYPKRLTCEASFLIPQNSQGGDQTLHGMISLPEKYASLVKPGSQVRIIVPVDGGGTPVRIEGVAAEIIPDPSGFCSVMVHIHPPAGMEDKILAAGRANAQIIIGESNLLRQVFDPIMSVLKGAKVNR